MRWRSADIHTSIGEFLVVRAKKKQKKTVELRSAVDALAQIFLAGELASECVLLYS